MKLVQVKGIVLLLLLLLTIIFVSCGSIIYPTFSHQSKLLDSSGNPVPDGSYDVVYKLYHEATEGTTVYTETTAVDITDGYFNSAFGTTAVDPKIFSQQTWLEISINGETLSPRQLLRGMPLAW